jgi:hypothetical protein
MRAAARVPALASRHTFPDRIQGESERRAERPRHAFHRGIRRPDAVLVVAEVALALVLVIGAGLMIKGFLRLLDVNLGFDLENVAP